MEKALGTCGKYRQSKAESSSQTEIERKVEVELRDMILSSMTKRFLQVNKNST